VEDNAVSVEMSVDTTSKSTANLAMSRARPVSVPVHKLADDPGFRKLVSCNTLHIALCNNNDDDDDDDIHLYPVIRL